MKTLDGKNFLMILKYGFINLETHIEELNRLNVFPVPDGDTGVNMAKTMSGVVNIDKVDTISNISKECAASILQNSRGNSGTILATFYLSLAKSFKDLEEVTVNELLEALKVAHLTCYKALENPVEGTILTVMDDITKIDSMDSMEELFKSLVDIAYLSVSKTKNMLKQLKDNDVVDAGALGFYYIIEGEYNALINNFSFFNNDELVSNTELNSFDNDVYQFRIEGIVKKNDDYYGLDKTDSLKDLLSSSSEVVSFNETDSLIKLRLYGNDDNAIKAILSRFGIVLNYKVENIRKIEDNDTVDSSIEIVSTITGDGFYSIYSDFNIEYCVMAEDFDASFGEYEKVINNINKKNIIILTNNKNNILTANLIKKQITNKNIYVLNTCNEAEGLIALSYFDEELPIEENISNMENGLESAKTFRVSKALKNYSDEKISVNKGEWVLLDGNNPIYSSVDIYYLISKIKKEVEDYNIISLFYGDTLDEEKANRFKDILDKETNYSKDIYLYEGGQKLYAFIISLEK